MADVHENFTIDVKLPPITVQVKVPSSFSAHEEPFLETVIVNNVAKLDVKVIYCGSSDDGDNYYFGQGPIVNSIAVYFKFPNTRYAEIAGVFTDIN